MDWRASTEIKENEMWKYLLSSDRHKTNHAGRPAFWRDLAYDPEELGTVARQHEERQAIRC
jgi:hypothetical protein